MQSNASFEALSPRLLPRPADLADSFVRIRAQTERLAAPLSPEDCCVQSMPDASPTKWHLAHTSWFFETFVLEGAVPGYRVFDPSFRVLFNSYYNGVGDQHPRPQRGLLTRPSRDEVLAYRAHVDRHVAALLASGDVSDARLETIELGLHHEQQHQELLLTDVKHLLAANPLRPAYRSDLARAATRAVAPARWHRFATAIREIGSDASRFHFDNEAPRHAELVHGFEIASRPVTNGEFLVFVESDAYAQPAWWLADGFAALRAEGWQLPGYWERRGDALVEFTLGGLRPLDLAAPVAHLSFYEAEAFARWSDARLPTEAEWEIAAAGVAVAGNFVERDALNPLPLASDAHDAPSQLFGDVWEWTASPYLAYPGFRPAPGAIGEYNGKFMCNQFVLRGGSCATPRDHVRASYRNFFPPAARWQWSGLRLARDAR